MLLRESVEGELNCPSNVCVCCCLLHVPVMFAGDATGCRRLREWRRGLAALLGVMFLFDASRVSLYHTRYYDTVVEAFYDIYVHPNISGAPDLRSSISHPKTDFSKIKLHLDE